MEHSFKNRLFLYAGFLVFLIGLYLIKLHSYVLFHTLIEIFSIVIAIVIFVLVWNARLYLENGYFLIVGIAFLYIGVIDLIHTLSYKGMGVFPDYDANLPTQLWIAARYTQSLCFLVAPFFLDRKINRHFFVLAGGAIGIALLFLSLFSWNIFPTCFVEGSGLTPFKVVSEYVISLILLASILILLKKDKLDVQVRRLIIASLLVTVASEMSFTLYQDVYGFFNALGHFLKIIAFSLIYKAVIEIGFRRPFGLLFMDLKIRQDALRRSEEEHRRLIETLPLAVFVEIRSKLVYANPAFLTLFKAASPDEVIGMRLIDFISLELFDIIDERRRIMTEENRSVPPIELNLRCMDGTFIAVVSTPMPMIFQEQPAILSALYDITERKRSEVELQKAHKLLQIHNRKIEDLQARLKEQVIRDPLTGLFNRRYLQETLGRELARASRDGFPIGMVMIDIDHFKQVNDSHGHEAGDIILQALGRLLLGGIRTGDIACRYGGEEFLLILPKASRAITAERAEQWRVAFEALRTVYGGKTIQATISLGVAIYPEDGVTAEAVIRAADQAMYRAKALGRNRVVAS